MYLFMHYEEPVQSIQPQCMRVSMVPMSSTRCRFEPDNQRNLRSKLIYVVTGLGIAGEKEVYLPLLCSVLGCK